MNVIRWVIPTVLASVAVFGQTPPVRLEFEVASIKASSPSTTGQVNVGVQIDGAQVHCANFSLREYIRLAYRVKDYQISGPDWLASERFDIAAKLPAGAKREQVPDMMQSLLADRFGVKMHRETKELPAYAIVVGKGGLKMKESPPDPDADTAAAGAAPVNVTASGGRGGVSVNLGGGSYYAFANNRFEAKKFTMTVFADALTRYVDRPVVDMTGLQGKYDLTLQFTPEDYLAMTIRSAVAAGVSLPPEALKYLDNASDESLFSSVEALGLKLEPRKAPLEVLVIDQAAKAPTAN
jgi:uncharacterized protein (TIGR03435 family)